MDVIFLVNIFRLYIKVKSKFFQNCTKKNLYLSDCYYWDGSISFREVNKSFCTVERLVMENRTWTLYIVTPKYSDCMQEYTMPLEQFDYKPVKDLAIATRYMIGRGPNCCLLSHVTGPLFCLSVKIFLPSIFNLIEF